MEHEEPEREYAPDAPYECGVFECRASELIKNTSLVLCNRNGDSLFYWGDLDDGRKAFLASPVDGRVRASLKGLQKRIPWSAVSSETGHEKDFLFPRSALRQVCRRLNLTLLKESIREMSPEERAALAERCREMNKSKRRASAKFKQQVFLDLTLLLATEHLTRRELAERLGVDRGIIERAMSANRQEELSAKSWQILHNAMEELKRHPAGQG